MHRSGLSPGRHQAGGRGGVVRQGGRLLNQRQDLERVRRLLRVSRAAASTSSTSSAASTTSATSAASAASTSIATAAAAAAATLPARPGARRRREASEPAGLVLCAKEKHAPAGAVVETVLEMAVAVEMAVDADGAEAVGGRSGCADGAEAVEV